MSNLSILRLALVSVCATASVARAQKATPCTLVSQPTTRVAFDSATNAAFAGGGVLIRCPGRGITLRGDSAEQYPDHDYMVGNVVFDDPRLHTTSNFLNYFPATEIVKAVGNVKARLPNGSTLTGPIAEYRRIAKGVRTHEQMLAIARPTIDILQKDSSGKRDTTNIVANQVFMDGDSLIYAGGDVIITRREIGATADSTFLDQTHDVMHLLGKPQVKGKKEKPFTLNGDLIDLYSKNRKLQRVLARANAVAVSDSMTLKSDTIDLRVRDDLLDHAYAWGSKSRARVISPSQNVLADSLDVSMPGQKVRLVRALRNAFAQGKPDSAKILTEPPDTTDWIRGDTIVAHFDSLAANDTTKTPPIRRLVSTGHASSLYHFAGNDTLDRRPSIHYHTARSIIIEFNQQKNQQKVATVTAVDSIHGYLIEPRPDSTTRRAAQPATGATPAAKTPPPGPPPAKTPAKPPAKPPASADVSIPLPSKRP